MTLLEKVFGFDPKYGGRAIMMIGRMGTRKTTILRAYAEAALADKVPVIWRARDFRDQWHLIPSDKTVLVPEGSKVSFWEIPNGTMDRREISPKVREFASTEDLLHLLGDGLNVLVEPNLPRPWLAVWWVYFLEMLAKRENYPSMRKYPRMRVCFDEILDVFPSSTSQKTDAYSALMPNFASKFYEIRRSGVDLMMVGHASGDIHYDIRGSFTGIIYLHGSRAVQGWRVTDRALKSLLPGHAILELEGRFVEVPLHLPDNRQPSSFVSYARSTDYWVPDEGFKDGAPRLLDNRRDLLKKYRLWPEPRKVRIEKGTPRSQEKGEGIPPVNSSKITRKGGKKAAPRAGRDG